ncbi:hypothetical protein HYPSUDRAFT_150995 [Hypholoma sublateritium FD-334 SS-4]|uniref:Fungal-type protein kinase domain-containing protein n=1 Tax=Hypholoma sublateritium (strain FD-334 SS-4) TaxID=945553 RepID=A0A0D2NBK8_HYPSF|nr:hypothetical protein HYPSUDRAFT_150995 [Hypholoma sublateritium FD-334 SS-4]
MDPLVTFDRFTGKPLKVMVDGQEFTVITQIFASPYLFSRGTRVYIVADKGQKFHILKDSWVQSNHASSEVDNIQKISRMVEEAEGLTELFRALCPRFVAGDNDICSTDTPRDSLTSLCIGRTRRRIVSGPIGDPITSYRSRVELLQAFIDIANQLDFIANRCGLVHGDVSMNNILIVRLLPNIIAAMPPGPGLNPDVKDALANVVLPNAPCTNEGLSLALPTGGSLIDFDYSREKDIPSAKTSGTMPYMSLSMTDPANLAKVKHQLAHDLESLFLVFLHIVRFLSAPRGDIESDNDRPQRLQIARWHHEASQAFIFSDKKADLLEVYAEPQTYVTQYWHPVIPYLKKLFEAIYPDLSFINRDYSSPITPKTFVSILLEARNFCSTLNETSLNYATILATPKKRPSTTTQTAETRLKRPRNAKKRPTAARNDPQPKPRRLQVGRFSNWEDSAAT